MKTFELILKGTPQQLNTAIKTFYLGYKEKESRDCWILSNEINGSFIDPNLVEITLEAISGEQVTILAQTIPDEHCLFIVSYKEDDWPRVKGCWELIYSLLDRQGWLDVPKLQSEQSENKPPNWFPRTSKAIEKWKKMYAITQRKKKEYRKSYRNLDTADPKPSIEDLREAIALQMGEKPSERLLHNIIKAGDTGLLTE